MRRMLFLLAVAGCLIAGCGSSGSKPSTTAAASGSGTATTKAPSFSGSKSSDYCTLGRQVQSSSQINPTGDIKASFAAFDSVANKFLSVVPSQIKADAQTLVTAFRHFEQVVKNANYDYTKLSPADLQSLQDPNLKAAVDRITAYDAQVCGIGTTTSG
jgi:hypothetical protein